MTTATVTRLDVSTALELVRLLSEWIDNGRKFTCYDITRELRERNQMVRHQAVLDFVHSLNGLDLPPFKGSNYGRFTTSFTTAAGDGQTAEVYRNVSDTSDYDPDQGQQVIASVVAKVTGPNQVTPDVLVKATTPVAQPACRVCNGDCKYSKSKTGVAPVTTPTVSNTDKHSVDNRGRICVRNSLIRSMSLNVGDRVYLQKTPGGINVMRTTPVSGFIGSLKVDRDGNVRVTRHIQRKAGAVASEFAMELKNGSVVLTTQ